MSYGAHVPTFNARRCYKSDGFTCTWSRLTTSVLNRNGRKIARLALREANAKQKIKANESAFSSGNVT